MTGKNKCKILKEIRRKIASDNDIKLVVEECRYQGECRGTCPRCEAELEYLERELAKRKEMGKAIAITAAASLLIGYAAGESQLVEKVVLEPIERIIDQSRTTGIVADVPDVMDVGLDLVGEDGLVQE